MDIKPERPDEGFKLSVEKTQFSLRPNDPQNSKAFRVREMEGFTIVLNTPPLISFNGTGFGLYGKSDLSSEDGVYLTNHYFKMFYCPLLPLGRYCVVELSPGQYDFVGELPLRIADKIHRAVVVVLLALAVACLTQLV